MGLSLFRYGGGEAVKGRRNSPPRADEPGPRRAEQEHRNGTGGAQRRGPCAGHRDLDIAAAYCRVELRDPAWPTKSPHGVAGVRGQAWRDHRWRAGLVAVVLFSRCPASRRRVRRTSRRPRPGRLPGGRPAAPEPDPAQARRPRPPAGAPARLRAADVDANTPYSTGATPSLPAAPAAPQAAVALQRPAPLPWPSPTAGPPTARRRSTAAMAISSTITSSSKIRCWPRPFGTARAGGHPRCRRCGRGGWPRSQCRARAPASRAALTTLAFEPRNARSSISWWTGRSDASGPARLTRSPLSGDRGRPSTQT